MPNIKLPGFGVAAIGGPLTSRTTIASLTDADEAYVDYDAASLSARFGAKGNGAGTSRGVKIRTLNAGAAVDVLSFTAAGAATFGGPVTVPGAATFQAGVSMATTLGVTGVHTASGGITLAGGPGNVAAQLAKTATNGVSIAGAAGSTYDLVLLARDGATPLLANVANTSTLKAFGTLVARASNDGVTDVYALDIADQSGFVLNTNTFATIFGTPSFGGEITVREIANNYGVGKFLVDAAGATVVKMGDSLGNFSVVKDTASKINVYIEGGYVKVQNRMANNITYKVLAFRVHSG